VYQNPSQTRVTFTAACPTCDTDVAWTHLYDYPGKVTFGRCACTEADAEELLIAS